MACGETWRSAEGEEPTTTDSLQTPLLLILFITFIIQHHQPNKPASWQQEREQLLILSPKFVEQIPPNPHQPTSNFSSHVLGSSQGGPEAEGSQEHEKKNWGWCFTGLGESAQRILGGGAWLLAFLLARRGGWRLGLDDEGE